MPALRHTLRAILTRSARAACVELERELAVQEIRKALELRPDDTNILYNAACVYGLLEQKAEALALLLRLKQAGILNVDWARRDPDLAGLHQDPEFLALIGSAPPA